MNTPNPKPHLRIAVDIGGTFTDMAAFDETSGQLLFGKALSTHGELVKGIQSTIDSAHIDWRDGNLFLHGSTIAINTLLERNGAHTALLITEGFRDIYEIGRVNRPDAYNLFFNKHQPLVKRSLRYEVAERLRADGSTHKPLDEAAVRELAKDLRGQGIEAVAVLLLHSYRNPAHEQRVKQILQEEIPGAFVCASHELSQEYREFERVSTAVANAYVGPRVSAYLGELEAHLSHKGFGGDFYVVQSTGGLFPSAHARRDCVRMLESGPAAGVIGAQAICAQLGMGDAIAFDMGGTTAKAGVISEGRPLTTGSALIGGYERALPIQIPMMDIHEVGTGGGSIARVETGNALRVGPQSAGSIPGPVAYGRGGTEATVTDADLTLGYLNADFFLGGAMKIDRAATEAALRGLATALGVERDRAGMRAAARAPARLHRTRPLRRRGSAEVIVDSSAIVAILLDEGEADTLIETLGTAEAPRMSAGYARADDTAMTRLPGPPAPSPRDPPDHRRRRFVDNAVNASPNRSRHVVAALQPKSNPLFPHSLGRDPQ